jgi:hypothetical protein
MPATPRLNFCTLLQPFYPSLLLLAQELQNERERNTVLQRQLQEQARSMQEATSKASTLSDDNQKLKDAVERLSKSATDKTDETVRYMQEAGELRKANITLEAAAQQAKDEKASAERKLQALERVSCACMHQGCGPRSALAAGIGIPCASWGREWALWKQQRSKRKPTRHQQSANC